MPRKPPPEGFITSSQARAILGTSLYRYVERGALKHYTLPTRTQGFYKLSEVEAVKRAEEAFFEQGILPEEEPAPEQPTEELVRQILASEREHHVEFAQATVEDMDAVYEVAAKLFPHGTTSAEGRKPLVAREPRGNYIVRDNGRVMAYIHLQPLREDVMQAFLAGRIRGSQLRAADLEPFVPGLPAQLLIKSVGAIGEGSWPSYYIRRLLIGAARDLGRQGILISKLYATSETPTGIGLSLNAEMRVLRKIGKGRFAFELDVDTSQERIVRIYKQALDQWYSEHPEARSAPARPPAAAAPIVASASTPRQKTASPADTLPGEYKGFADMFRDHGIAETTANRGRSSGKFSTIEGRWYARGRLVKYALDAGQQRAFIQAYQGYESFHRCEDPLCPCHEICRS